jgi:hypothetical protein
VIQLYLLIKHNCTTFVSQNLPSKGLLFNLFVKPSFVPAELGFGLDISAIKTNNRGVQKLPVLPK